MLYKILKIPAKFALYFYCISIKIKQRHLLNFEGPLLICANHPNSFLDAIIIATLFKRPVHSLVRGDVYKNSFYSKLLFSLNMLPVYRVTEGVENLEHNYSTFEKCKDIFRQNGVVLIFSEGRCINEWKLRPLMKGTARLALSSWQENINLMIMPLGINYDSFRSFGKKIKFNIGKPYSLQEIKNEPYGKAIQIFNNKLKSELDDLVFESKDTEEINKHFQLKSNFIKTTLLFLPAIAGYIVFAPPYYIFKSIIKRKWNNDHFDSILVSGGFFIFPFFIIVLTIITLAITKTFISFLIIPLLLFCGYSSIQLKYLLK